LGGREWHCVLQNCEQDVLKSLGYAVRNAFARMSGMIRDNVTVFIVLSEFQKRRFIAGGIAESRLTILPNIARTPTKESAHQLGDTVAFVGRLSEEKGIREFLAAAAVLPDVPFAVAGDPSDVTALVAKSPPNVKFAGFLTGPALESFFSHARMIVCPSKWFEGFPNVIVQAMAHEKPVIASRIGAIPEIVEEGVTGILTAPSDVEALSGAIATLWNQPESCRAMGTAGKRKADTVYSRDAFQLRLNAIYDLAYRLSGNEWSKKT
jgi:glycosyltransferase involved in cell wall biosynthesis